MGRKGKLIVYTNNAKMQNYRYKQQSMKINIKEKHPRNANKTSETKKNRS